MDDIDNGFFIIKKINVLCDITSLKHICHNSKKQKSNYMISSYLIQGIYGYDLTVLCALNDAQTR